MIWTVRIVRSLLGLLFLFASVTYLFHLITPPPPVGAMKVFDDGMRISRYMLPTVKALELLCGLALLSGRFVPLALVVLAPIMVNIVGVHLVLAPEGLPVAGFVLLATLFLAWHHRSAYLPLLRP